MVHVILVHQCAVHVQVANYMYNVHVSDVVKLLLVHYVGHTCTHVKCEFVNTCLMYMYFPMSPLAVCLICLIIMEIHCLCLADFLQGVESERCPSFTMSLEAGCPTYTNAHSTLADGKEGWLINNIFS